MAVTVIATPGASNANSYLLLSEMQSYMDSRPPVDQWDNADDQNMLLVWGTRVFEAMFSPRRLLIRDPRGFYYRTFPTWNGAPASTTQALAFPRTGLFTKNGAVVDPSTIPSELKAAVAEFIASLAVNNTTLDNDVITQGITSIRAGSVALTFKSGAGEIEAKVIPDAVFNLIPPSWLTDELIEYTTGFFDFTVL